MNLNIFKSNVFYPNISELEKHRLYVKEDEINEFWDSLTLIEMENLLTMRDKNIIYFLEKYLEHYLKLKERKASSTEAYEISIQGKLIAHIYDCKIFKSSNFLKEVNEMFSSFLIASKFIEEDIKE